MLKVAGDREPLEAIALSSSALRKVALPEPGRVTLCLRLCVRSLSSSAMLLEITFDVAPAELFAGEEELQDDAAVVEADVVVLFLEGGRVFFAA